MQNIELLYKNLQEKYAKLEETNKDIHKQLKKLMRENNMLLCKIDRLKADNKRFEEHIVKYYKKFVK